MESEERSPLPAEDSCEEVERELCADLTVEAGQTRRLHQEDIDGLEFPDQRGPGLALADLNNDGWLDLVWAIPVGGSRIFLNDKTGWLEEVEGRVLGETRLPPAIAVAAADLNGDGDTDLVFASSTGESDSVLTGLDGLNFSSKKLPKSEGESKTISIADADNDGDLDLFICGFSANVPINPTNDPSWTEPVGEGNFLYLKEPDGSWLQAQDALPSEMLNSQCYQGTWLDSEGDGDLDLYISNESGMDFVPNQLLLNDGAGHFEVDPDCNCNLAIEGMGGALGDVNGDSLPDLYLTDIGRNHLLVNLGEQGFVNETAARQALPDQENIGSSWGTQFVDLDRDGFEDLVTSYGRLMLEEQDDAEGDVILVRQENGTFLDVSREVGFEGEGMGRNVVVGDLDRDGRPDIVTGGVQLSHGAYFFRTWFSRGGCPTGVRLVFSRSFGFGPRVEVTLPSGRTYNRWLENSSTYGASAPELTLGFAGWESASITVHWPGGASQVLGSLRSGAVREVQTP